MRRGDEPLLHRELLKKEMPTKPLEALRVLAYDPDAEKLVHVSIPFWLLRLAPSGKRMSFLSDNGVDFDSDRVHLTLDDIERRGPGLILDQKDLHDAYPNIPFASCDKARPRSLAAPGPSSGET